jgi:diaminohydroxyphosphoribosylaminopyrimidine deaminase/5-amino-6-(5-phosphoribosylamino)uracil reductase
VEILRTKGCEILALAGNERRPSVTELLDELGKRRMTNILVEGGAEVLGSFLDARAIDECHVVLAPRLAGGGRAKSPIAGQGVAQLSDTLNLVDWRVEPIEGDVIIQGLINPQRASSE